MLTKTDINKLKGIFVTKHEFQKVTTEIRNEIINFKDAILNEIVKLREDISVVVGYRGMLEDHDQRITKLEKKTTN